MQAYKIYGFSFEGVLWKDCTWSSMLDPQQHRKFVGCERDQNRVAEAMLSRAKTFFRQLLNKDSNMTALKDVLSATKNLDDALDRIVTKNKPMFELILRRLVNGQTSPEHIPHFMLMNYKNKGMFKEFCNVPTS